MSELSVNLETGVKSANPAGQSLADRSLMQRVALGESRALEELIEQHGPMLARLVGRLLAWHADCDDVLQDVLLTVWQRADRFQATGSLEGWLRRIAVNRCRNHFRAIHVLQRKLEQFARMLTRVSPAPSAGVYAMEPVGGESKIDCPRRAELETALARLPPTDRTAIVLFYLEGMSGDEVASLLGIKVETLHVRLHRIRKKLKRILEIE